MVSENRNVTSAEGKRMFLEGSQSSPPRPFDKYGSIDF
jgi:hypothetical protein